MKERSIRRNNEGLDKITCSRDEEEGTDKGGVSGKEQILVSDWL